MNENFKYHGLKFKIFGKDDNATLKIIEPLETKFAAVRRLKTYSKTHYLAIIRYLIFLFDPGTDLNRDFVRLEDRRAEAAKISGLNKLTDLKKFDEVYNCNSADVLDVIQILLTEVYFDIDYREWQTLHRELDEYTGARWDKTEARKKRRKKGDDGEGEIVEVAGQNKAQMETLNLKSKLREDCKRIRELLEELDRKIFGDNLDIKEVAYKSRFLNPESFSGVSKTA